MTNSPFRYAGSKAKILPILMPHIESLMEGQNHFIDLFVGGGSVLLEVAKKYPNVQLYANDKDYWVSSFWKIIADPDTYKLTSLLGMMEAAPTTAQFYKLRAAISNDDVECAYRAIFFNRTAFSGILKSGPIGGKDQKSKYTIDCRYNYKKLCAKIMNCHNLLSGRTKVSCNDFSQHEEFVNTEYPVYLDPPYYDKGAILYTQYMLPKEHQNLSNFLQQRKRWVLSYDDCKEIRNFYSQNNIIDLAARYCINGKKDNWKSKKRINNNTKMKIFNYSGNIYTTVIIYTLHDDNKLLFHVYFNKNEEVNFYCSDVGSLFLPMLNKCYYSTTISKILLNDYFIIDKESIKLKYKNSLILNKKIIDISQRLLKLDVFA